MAKGITKSNNRRESIYVISGKDEPLVGAECKKLLEELLEPEQKMTGLLDADASSVSVSEVLDELRTVPFLTDKRVVVIKSADDFVSENRQILEKYFSNPSPTGVLVLTVSSWMPQTKLAKQLPSVGKLISVTQPKPWQLPQHLCRYAKESYGKRISDDAAALLVELAGDDLSRLYSEVDKLATFADKQEVITAHHVELLIGHNRLFNAFAAIDAIMAGNAAKAVERLRIMFAEDKDSEYRVVGAFAFHFRKMFNAKVMLERSSSPSEITGQLQIRGNKEGFFAAVRKVSLRQIGGYLRRLAEIDHAIKTGRTRTQVAMEQLVLGLANAFCVKRVSC